MAEKMSEQRIKEIMKKPMNELTSSEFAVYLDEYKKRRGMEVGQEKAIQNKLEQQVVKADRKSRKDTELLDSIQSMEDELNREKPKVKQAYRKTAKTSPINTASIKITHPSLNGNISVPSDFNKIRHANKNSPFVFGDNSHNFPPHTYDLTSKAGIKKYRQGSSAYFANRNNYMQNNPDEFTAQATSKREMKPSEQHTYPRPKPFERPTPINNFDHLLPHGGIRSRDTLITNKPEIRPYGKAPIDSVNNSAHTQATEEARKTKKSKSDKGESAGVMNITAKTVNIKSDKINGGGKSKSTDEKGETTVDAKGAKPVRGELLKLTSKMVIGRILLPNIDPDVRLLMTLIMKPVMGALGRAIKGVGAKVRDAWKFRGVDADDGGLVGRVKSGVKNMKLGERWDTLKSVPSNIKDSAVSGWDRVKKGTANIRKSTSDMWNDVSQKMKTTDSVTSGEEPQMGKVRRSYGIFFNYLNNKSNIFKGSITKMFDSVFSNTMKFGGMIGKFFKGFGGKKGEDGKGGWLNKLLSTLGGLFPKLIGLVGGLITKIVSVIGIIGAMIKSLGGVFGRGGGTLDGDVPDRRRNKKGKGGRGGRGGGGTGGRPNSGRPTPKKGLLSKAWNGIKSIPVKDTLSKVWGGAKNIAKSSIFGKAWKGAKTIGKKALQMGGLKALGKSAVKKIPVLGLLAGLGFGAHRLLSGDFKGAGMEVMSGLASTVPIVGTGASVGMDVALMAHDAQRNKITAQSNDISSELFKEAKEYNINKDVKGQEVKVQPVIIDNSSSTISNGGGGGGFVGSPEPLIIDPRNNILTHIVINSLSKGTI